MISRYFHIFIFSLFLSIIGFIYFYTFVDSARYISVLAGCLAIFISSLLSGLATQYYLANKIYPQSKKEDELKSLKTLEKYRREFFGNVSHELKTPIFNIQGYVETLIGGALYDKSVNKKYLKRTSKSIDRLIYIIQDLETISQLESEELKLELTTWNLSHLINEIVDQFEIKLKEKKIQLTHDKTSTNFRVFADKGKMSQVLYNLISNSIKYGKKGGITIIRCHQAKSICKITIKDNGIGVSEKNITRLFERFYRVDKSRSREQGGTGLGLAIVKHIIDAHDQAIDVKSIIGKGTEFVFSIERAKSNNN